MSDSIYIPLAERLRPQKIEDIQGQEALLGKHGNLGIYLTKKQLPSMILWGPPGSGKTTLARVLVQYLDNNHFVSLSAVSAGVSDIKKVCTEAEELRKKNIQTIVFIDEIHRFNKSQQDTLLHFVEEGSIILIGATTENPSFEINKALLSRLKVFVLKALNKEALEKIWQKAENYLNYIFDIEELAKESIFISCGGDARTLLNILEQLFIFQKDNKLKITEEIIKNVDMFTPSHYDKTGDQHYNLISALHKSIRGSDCDAALYWFSRMLDGGELPLYIGRRLLRMAYEDIGLADISAPQYIISAIENYERLGSPEGELGLACAVIYLALAPKSNSAYNAFSAAKKASKEYKNKTPPKHILNAPTTLMKELGYGKSYIYDHDTELGFSGQNYFPDQMSRHSFYHPIDRGFEREMQKRLLYFEKLRNIKQSKF